MRAGLLMLLALAGAPSHAAWQDVFSHLDLTRPGLEALRAAVEAGDLDEAAVELKAYYQARVEPHFISDRHSRPEANPEYNTAYAERTLRREFSFVGKPATLTHDIDWNADPLKDVEWPIELNRHGPWVGLARAYWYTDDEEYAEDLAYQIADWLADNPRPESPRGARWTWRTLELGIRLSGSWPEVLFRAIDSEHMTPELVCGILEGIYQQADYLTRYGGGGNWLVCEKSGQLTTAIVFPEFADAPKWAEAAWDVLVRELESQVLPDGAQVELTPHYHGATLSSFRRAYDIAAQNNVEPPPAYRDHMLRMYEYLMYVVKPDGFIPMWNDSDHGNMRGWMRDGAARFEREDMRYLATGGEEGAPPEKTSVAFPWAGQYAMRSGWTQDDMYLAMDAGPYGYGHQHEDKLSVDVWAFGQEMIVDPGRFTYAAGKWRGYFLSTASHPTMLVDGAGQNRRRTPRSTWVSRDPLHNRWATTEGFDYACGSYEDGYAGAEDVIHVRKVLFIKPNADHDLPGYFIVSDLLLPYAETDDEHEATVQYQLTRAGTVLDEETLAAHTVGPDANVLIQPVSPEGVTVTMHEGEEDPPAGWVAWSLHAALKEPATLLKYSKRGKLPLAFTTVILPYKGEEPPEVEVGGINGSMAVEVAGEGWRDSIWLSHDPSGTRLGPERVERAVYRYANGDEPIVVAKSGSVPADDAPVVDLDKAAVSLSTDEPSLFRLRYGYASGGGYLFETETTEPAAEATLSIQNPKLELTYTHLAQANAGDGWKPMQRGTILVPQPEAFDFEDETLQGWEAASAELVDGANGSKGALRVEGAARAEPIYLSASRPHRLTTTALTQVKLAYRTPGTDAGDWFYAKVTLRDNTGVDWSAYFAREPAEEWREVTLPLAEFKGDTQDHPQHGKPMPEGTKIVRVSVTMRKGETDEPSAAALELDNIAIAE